jgi:hypothetical protein
MGLLVSHAIGRADYEQNGGRHQIGTVRGIRSVYPGGFVGIRKESRDIAAMSISFGQNSAAHSLPKLPKPPGRGNPCGHRRITDARFPAGHRGDAGLTRPSLPGSRCRRCRRRIPSRNKRCRARPAYGHERSDQPGLRFWLCRHRGWQPKRSYIAKPIVAVGRVHAAARQAMNGSRAAHMASKPSAIPVAVRYVRIVSSSSRSGPPWRQCGHDAVTQATACWLFET